MKLMLSILAAAIAIAPLSASAQKLPPLNRSNGEVTIENQTSLGAWVTAYRYAGALGIKTGQTIVGAWCVEGGRTEMKRIAIDVSKVRVELLPGCRGAKVLDQEHLAHSAGFSGGPGKIFTQFKGRLYRAGNKYIFQDIT